MDDTLPAGVTLEAFGCGRESELSPRSEYDPLMSRGHNPDSRFEETLHTAAHSRSCFSLSWSPGGLPEDQGGLGLLASSGGDGKIIVWQVKGPPPVGDGDPDATQQGLKMEPIAAARDAHGVADVNCVAWCVREDGKGRGMLGSVGDDGTIKVWRVIA